MSSKSVSIRNEKQIRESFLNDSESIFFVFGIRNPQSEAKHPSHAIKKAFGNECETIDLKSDIKGIQNDDEINFVVCTDTKVVILRQAELVSAKATRNIAHAITRLNKKVAITLAHDTSVINKLQMKHKTLYMGELH